MIPYFYKLDKPVFSQETVKGVSDFVLANLDKFQAYYYDDGKTPDGNNFYAYQALLDFPEIHNFRENSVLKCFPMVVLHKPNTSVIRHTDDPNKRNTVILTSIFPEADYAPTFFWKNSTDDEPVATLKINSGDSVIFNTQQFHSLVNVDTYRFNLQMCFDEDFDTVLKLYQTDNLFKKS